MIRADLEWCLLMELVMKKLSSFSVLTLLSSSLFIHALPASEIKSVDKTLKEYENVCDKNSDYYKKTGLECAVKKVRFETNAYSIRDPGDLYPYYGTLAYSGFEANSWDDVAKYAFVQQIRGCTYEIQKNADGTFKKRIGETINHLGKKRIYVFPEWSIDATTNDPLYYGPSVEDAKLPGGRVSLYRWTPKLGVIEEKKTKDLYQMLRLSEDEKLNYSPSVFVTDSPSMAYLRDVSSRTFQNVSLEFNICLYNIADIPLSIVNDDPMNAPAIVCHQWSSQFEFNFQKNKYEHLPSKGLDSFCASQEPISPLEALERGL